MPTISVIIPTYNRATLLPEAIQSVLTQTYRDFELLIIDDGSTDNTRQVIETFQDERIRYIYRTNGGISAALNTGIRAAQGQFMARLDSDDYWLPSLLEQEVNILITHPDIHIVYTQAQSIDKHGQLLTSRIGRPERYPGQPLKSILCGDFRCSITSLIRMECFKQVGMFDETLKGNEDWEIGIRLARHYRFYFIPQVLAHYRSHTQRTTAVKSAVFTEIVNSRLRVLDKVFADIDLPPDILAIRPLAYRNVHAEMAFKWDSAGEHTKARAEYWAAIKASQNPPAALIYFFFIWFSNHFLVNNRWTRHILESTASLLRKLRARKS